MQLPRRSACLLDPIDQSRVIIVDGGLMHLERCYRHQKEGRGCRRRQIVAFAYFFLLVLICCSWRLDKTSQILSGPVTEVRRNGLPLCAIELLGMAATLPSGHANAADIMGTWDNLVRKETGR